MKRELFSKVLLKNSLVGISLDELENQMNSDSSLKELLTTEASDLPEEYLYLLGETFPNWETSTLLDLILMSYRNLPIGSCYFSKSGSRITGWVAFTIDYDDSNNQYVSNLKMFSFDTNRPNVVLLRDLKVLVDVLLEQYSKVCWIAVKDNPANKIYEKVVKDYNGKAFVIDNSTIRYVITKEE